MIAQYWKDATTRIDKGCTIISTSSHVLKVLQAELEKFVSEEVIKV